MRRYAIMRARLRKQWVGQSGDYQWCCAGRMLNPRPCLWTPNAVKF